jgi:hypothetical protein
MGGTESYWVHLSRGGNWIGAGFLLVGSYVLTAHHCLGNDEQEIEDVEVKFENGEVFLGRIHRRCPEADLALIDVPKFGRGPVIPRTARPGVGDTWRSPYQPSHSDVFLTGMIDAVLASYECAGGDFVEAMQLGCNQDLEDYGGYSGSPIESEGSNGNKRLIGVLIEQHLRHYPASRVPRPPSSRVLFATTLTEVLRRFDCFAVDHLMDLLPSSSGDGAAVSDEKIDKPVATGSSLSDVQANILAIGATIEALPMWFKPGELDEREFTDLKLEIIRRYLPGRDAESRHE